MFLNEKFEYEIIDDSVSTNDLILWCKENEVDIQFHTLAERWCAFTNYYGRTNGLDVLASASMGYVVSNIFGGIGVSSQTEVYYREDDIVFDCLDYLNNTLLQRFNDKVKIAQVLFSYIFDIYNYHIHQYEYKDHQIGFRLGESTLARFNEVEGDTKSEKFFNLIQYYHATKE